MKDVNGILQYKGKDYRLVFNLNVMEAIQEEYGTLSNWGELTGSADNEPNAKAVLFGLKEMINEGIDINNEETGSNEPPMTHKQVGRMLTDIGLMETMQKLQDTVTNSTKGEEKNE